MGRYGSIDIKSLIGETLTHIDVFDGPENNHEILLTTSSGRQIKIHHEQDCCESVGIENTDGVWQNLIGKVLIDANEKTEPYEEAYDSGTRTVLTFKVNDATVINRWIGESNGYYSEALNFDEIEKGAFKSIK